MKVTFMGAGSTVFSKNVLGDTMLCESFHDVEIALDPRADQIDVNRRDQRSVARSLRV